MKQTQSITTLAESPDDERRRRMIQYLVAMIIRVICIVLCLFVQGWWLLLPVAGAVLLPYVAVVLANVGSHGEAGTVLRPGALVPVPKSGAGPTE